MTRSSEATRWAFQRHDFIDVWNIGMYGAGDVARNLGLLGEVLP